MIKLTIVFILLASCSLAGFGQAPYAIRGTVRDTGSAYHLENTSVAVLHQKDSILVTFTRTNSKGEFDLTQLKPGNYILLLSYPRYADYAEEFVLDSLNPHKDFGRINMILKSALLEEVIVKGKAAAIKMKGDTTEFNAGSFIIKPNSKVEDLLKQLPGIQVDRKGRITAQGETVTKVLVDGEEFFADDPTLVTRNLRGDMVDKIQLYDKKSDQAIFTGIDDGKTEKTLNVKLKEDKKNGYFGKVVAAYGTKGFYESQAMINVFKNKEKMAVYGAVSNTGSLGLSTADAGKYSTSESELVWASDGRGTRMIDPEAFQGTYDGRGLPFATGGGLHYENKWKQDKYGLNSNYRLGSLEVKGTSNEFTVNNLPGETTRTNSDRTFSNSAFRQKLDAKLDVKLDSLSTLKVTVAGTLSSSSSSEDFNTYTLREDDSFQNKSSRKLTNETDNKNVVTTTSWNRRLGKPGRTVSVNIRLSTLAQESAGLLNSFNEFFDQNNVKYGTESIDQYKTGKTSTQDFNSNIIYTEPIYKSLSVMLNYGLNMSKGRSDKQSFNKDLSGQYTLLDKVFSNNFELDQLSNAGGVIFNYNGSKTLLNFGTKIENVRFNQLDVYSGETLKRNFTNWNPQASYKYKLSKQANLELTYNGNMDQPRIEQIQPLRVNTNPLYEALGNPQLKPAFNNRFNISYISYKPIGGRSLYIFGNYAFTNNAISSSTLTDANGKTIAQTINIKDKTPKSYFIQVTSSRVIGKVNVGVNAGVNGSVNYNLTNNLLNTTKTTNYFLGPSLSRYAANFDFRFSLQPSYTTTRSILQQTIRNNQWGIIGDFNSTVPIPGKLALTVSANYEYKGRTAAFDNELNRLILDIDVYKTFLKNNNLRLTLYAKDLLNQNNGFIRNVNNNMIRQESFSTIRRYFLLALSWDFSKMGGSAIKN